MAKKDVKKAEAFLNRVRKLAMFQTKYKIRPPIGTQKLISEMDSYLGKVEMIENPSNRDELLQAEARLRVEREAMMLKNESKPRPLGLDASLFMIGVPKRDAELLKPWLLEHKAEAARSAERLYEQLDIDYFPQLNMDMLDVNRKVKAAAEKAVDRYHKALGGMVKGTTQVGEMFNSIKAVPSTSKGSDRSYFIENGNRMEMALAIPAFLYLDGDGNIGVNKLKLISHWGHEGMGHGLNKAVTRYSDIPKLLKIDTASIDSTKESVAQFYEGQIFEDLNNSPETQGKLGIKREFGQIYTENKDLSRLRGYLNKVHQYAALLLAETTPGQPKKEGEQTLNEKLAEVSFDEAMPSAVLEMYRGAYDINGRLKPSILQVLTYVPACVDRAMAEFGKNDLNYTDNRDLIDETLLTGRWSPETYVINAKFAAEEA